MMSGRLLFRSALLLAAPALFAARTLRRALGAVPRSRRTPVPPSWGSASPFDAAPMPAEVAPDPVRPQPVRLAPARVEPVDEAPVFASELPIAAYDALNARDANIALKKLTDPDQVRVMLRYEEGNAKRTTVHRAARLHLAALENAAVGSSNSRLV